jgi:hypothetical protein
MKREMIDCVAETMPADKYGYQPVKEVGAFGEQIKHAPPMMKLLLANAEGKTVSRPGWRCCSSPCSPRAAWSAC